ncbi:MAG TPA: aspartate dehydrogenase [Candidatus Methanoculleus thermohydrogenotrophicum]|jgi:aspartate dehydrogenase|nr:aspartate dehydrogenase [Candidatus Methanoculleus thermohydrogenotrophicum]NLM82298.1 aspartate dehydrogenase [Candidatus Methanoculleus thermohydrogenotrophicum]HOB18902.1 aspartate dehydrogenase [Candidatus Methanoculleus thermohydrogenotrophicum]HPZ38781.1 aspartate dehydrogenase [Candidatus Methanoculleus thermohydrogenotrophicum]HQC92051.1 aspartate dehydrogenase [Candidatus Methanoculleus thermohydrogenotrophicum]
MIKIGLLGCGNIGRIIAARAENVQVVAVFDANPGRAEELAALCHARPYTDFDAFMKEDFSIVVEAASIDAVRRYGEAILRSGRDIIVLSVGAFADDEFRERLVEAAREVGKKIRIPSGAIIGLDNLKIGQISPPKKLLLRTTKPPASLGMTAETRTEVFKGLARDCIKLYPKNINVAVALGLAAGRETHVELWVDPAVERIIHEISVEGDFGEISIQVKNVPSPDNPATSYMAALSVLTLLKNLENPLVVGT